MMRATQATLKGRAAAEALMVDTCTIVRRGAPVTNPDTGVVTYPNQQTVYSGKCRLKLPVAIARPDIVGGAQEFLQHPVLSLPATTTGVEVDDLVTITASLLMQSLVNRQFHVRAKPGQSHMTAARFEVMEVMG
jgi:hypothetical protein